MFRAVLVLICLGIPATADDIRFAPIDIEPLVYNGGWEHFVGGGLAVFDCDADGLPELFAAGGENQSVLLRNTSKRTGQVSFEFETPQTLQLTSVIGAYPLDIDNDAIADLVVLRVGPNLILKGGADCSFAPFEGLNVDLGSAWTTAFSATWEAGLTYPTLAFGNYVNRGDPDGPFEACDDSYLFRPNGEVYGDALKLAPSFCPLSMLFSDWGRTGKRDLRVSNDRHYFVKGGQEQLWSMQAVPQLYTEAEGWVKHELWGMGIASRDLIGNGIPEVMMTSMGDQRLQVLSGEGRPSFVDMPYDKGATAHRPYMGGDGRPSTGWHVEFGDVQNDGRDDIFIAKGNVEQMPGLAMKDPNNLLIQGHDGRFYERGGVAGLASMRRGRGATLTDLNGDGLLDVVVVNRRAEMEVFQNATSTNHTWISLRLHQDGANRHAIGSWIEVNTGTRVFARELTVGGGHAGGKLGYEHFGLGTVLSAKVRVVWPDQKTSDWVELSAGQYYDLDRIGTALVARY
jgi:hypothetical protein